MLGEALMTKQYHFKGVDEESGAMLFYGCPEHREERVCVFPLPSRPQPWRAEIVCFRRAADGFHYEFETVPLTDKRRIGRLMKNPLMGGWKLTVRN